MIYSINRQSCEIRLINFHNIYLVAHFSKLCVAFSASIISRAIGVTYQAKYQYQYYFIFTILINLCFLHFGTFLTKKWTHSFKYLLYLYCIYVT